MFRKKVVMRQSLKNYASTLCSITAGLVTLVISSLSIAHDEEIPQIALQGPVNLAENAIEQPRELTALERVTKQNLLTDGVEHNVEKPIHIKVKELRDTSGLVYVGGYVNAAELQPYLKQMQALLGEQFSLFRQNQANRDASSFHITLISPNEYQHIDKSTIKFDKLLSITLKGLGKVEKEQQASYFVVVNSSDATFFRQQLALSAKDFHVTLGFNPADIYDQRKGVDTLILK